MHVLVTYKNEVQIKMKVLEWQQHFSHCKSMVIFPDAQGQLTPQYQLIQVFVVVHITCKNEEDPIKNESAIVVTTLNINFQMLKGS